MIGGIIYRIYFKRPKKILTNGNLTSSMDLNVAKLLMLIDIDQTFFGFFTLAAFKDNDVNFNKNIDIMAKLVKRVEGTWNTKTRVDNYKLVLQELQTQFAEPDHPFNCIQVEFAKYILNTYNDISYDTIDTIKSSLLSEIRDIIKILCFVLIKFYQLDLQFNERNANLFLMPVTDLVVSKEISKHIIKLLEMKQEEEMNMFSTQLVEFKNLELSKLKLGKYFAFNKEFRATFPHKEDLKEGIVLSKAIRVLQKFKNIETPNAQLDQLLRLSDAIIQEVDRFWKGYEVDPEKLILDPDSFLSLLIYVIIKAQYERIYIQQQLMELFITEVDKGSTKGYYLVTLSIAIRWILEQNPKDIPAVSLLLSIGRH